MQVLWSTAEAQKWRRFRQTCTYQPSPNAFFRPFLHQAHTGSDPFYVTVINIHIGDLIFATFVQRGGGALPWMEMGSRPQHKENGQGHTTDRYTK